VAEWQALPFGLNVLSSPFSQGRGEQVGSLPEDQRVCRKAFFASGVQHAVDDGLIGGFLAGEDPEIFPVGGADEGSRIVGLQREDPVVPPGEGHPVGGELDLEFGIVGALDHAGRALGALCLACFAVGTFIHDADRAVLIEGIGRRGVDTVLLETVGIAGNLIPGAGIAGEVHLIDGGGLSVGIAVIGLAERAGRRQRDQREKGKGEIEFAHAGSRRFGIGCRERVTREGGKSDFSTAFAIQPLP